jgi:hypothetical protein
MELYNLIILVLQMYHHRKHLLAVALTLFDAHFFHRADRSPALAAMTLRSSILGSSNGDVIFDESNSLAEYRVIRSCARICRGWLHCYSLFGAVLDLAM